MKKLILFLFIIFFVSCSNSIHDNDTIYLKNGKDSLVSVKILYGYPKISDTSLNNYIHKNINISIKKLSNEIKHNCFNTYSPILITIMPPIDTNSLYILDIDYIDKNTKYNKYNCYGSQQKIKSKNEFRKEISNYLNNLDSIIN